MNSSPTTLLERLAKDGFPIELFYAGRKYIQPLASMILSGHSILDRAQKEWTYKSLADFGAEDFILNSAGWGKHPGWEEDAVRDFSHRIYCLAWFEENEGLSFHVRDGDKFRPAKKGDAAYDFVCRLREDGSISDLRFTSAPSWAHELHLFQPNYFAHKILWSEVPGTKEPLYGLAKKMRADAVVRETIKLAEAADFLKPSDASAATPSDGRQDDAWDGGFNQDHPKYPAELDIALQAWLGIRNVDSSISPRKQLENWLKKSYPDLSVAAVDRIVGVCNWDKTGGRPKAE